MTFVWAARCLTGRVMGTTRPDGDQPGRQNEGALMGYGIGGILILILVILAIIYFAKRV